MLAHVAKQLPERRVGVGDFAVVGILEVSIVWSRRVVGGVRIIYMNPQKERAALILAEPCDCMLDYIPCSTLDRVVAAFVRFVFWMEPSVERIKSALESRCHAGFRVKDE